MHAFSQFFAHACLLKPDLVTCKHANKPYESNRRGSATRAHKLFTKMVEILDKEIDIHFFAESNQIDRVYVN